MSFAAAIVWFHQDLRLEDNPALQAALASGGPIIPVYIWSPTEEGRWPPGAASRYWLHHSLRCLDAELRRHGSRLILRRGDALFTLSGLAQETGATAIYWNRRYEPAAIARDAAIKSALRAFGLAAESFNGSLLFEPWEVNTKEGKPYRVFTPFYKACLSLPSPPPPNSGPETIPSPKKWCGSLSLEALELEPKIDWANGIRRAWLPGTAGAQGNLDLFLGQAAASYADDRDRPDQNGTSCLSPHLHFGEISPRTIWHAVRERFGLQPGTGQPHGPDVFLKEIVWREFAYHLLYHFPHTPEQPFRPAFAAFPWEDNPIGLRAWQQGRTGYPLVDAGMRQLWTTGWMHNRVRMVVASFLVKHLRLSWLGGADWFWDTLVDADLANNTLGWQWSAGCGADAAPYFRIFNPITQGEKFDLKGDYVRRWVPELADLPTAWIHKPWQAPTQVLESAGVFLGKTYPTPIVDHAAARAEALEALTSISKGKEEE